MQTIDASIIAHKCMLLGFLLSEDRRHEDLCTKQSFSGGGVGKQKKNAPNYKKKLWRNSSTRNATYRWRMTQSAVCVAALRTAVIAKKTAAGRRKIGQSNIGISKYSRDNRSHMFFLGVHTVPAGRLKPDDSGHPELESVFVRSMLGRGCADKCTTFLWEGTCILQNSPKRCLV